MVLNKEQIKEFLPHRFPFLFVDEVASFEAGKKITASLYLDKNMPFFEGHFPNNPIMPGVLIVEALAQTSGLLIALTAKEKGDNPSQKLFYLASNNIKFIKPILPENTLELSASLTRDFNGLFHFSVEASTHRDQIAHGSLVLASSENVSK